MNDDDDNSLKRPVEHMKRADDVSTIHATTPSKRVIISSQERNIELPQDAHYQHIEELDIRNCNNAVSVDLSTSDIGPALRIIRIIGNGPIEQLTFPSRCSNLEELIIMDNWPGLEVLPEVDPRLLHKLREQHYPYRNWGIGELENSPTLQERRMYWKELEIPRPREPVEPPVFDLSGLDGSPRLRIFKVANNGFGYSGIILTSHCPNLEAVIINETRVIEWRLENCPKLKLVRIVIPNQNYGTLDVMPLFAHFQSSTALPLVSITIKLDWGIDLIDNFKGLPKEFRKRMAVAISGYQHSFCIPPCRTGRIWDEERKLGSYYGIYTIPETPFRKDAWNDYRER